LYFYAVSYDYIGKCFLSGWIKDYLDTSNDVMQYKKFYSCDEGRQIVQQYLSTSRKHYPNIMSEIQGMADGAAVNFEDLFLLQLSSEIEFCHLNEILGDQESNQVEKGCTDVLVNRKQCRVIGHNDDWTNDVSSRVYIVHVTILDETDHVTEQFVSFSYPGYLTGFCFGMNQSLVISLNSLSPKRANKMGVPLAILLRSLFAYNSIDECYNVMESKPYGCAYGMTINIASINGTEMCSMEIYPQEVRVRLLT
jgi:isopenicillin-N N-acyltransferase-like protein